MNISYINDIINRKFNTDKGYLYFCDLIKEEYPSFKINENNMEKLIVKDIDGDYFDKTGFVGVYTAKDNVIGIFTNKDENGKSIYPNLEISDDELLNTFLHELVHCMTSKVDKDNASILEGLNVRTMDGQSSYFLGINEGITQMITDDLLGVESDAYPIQTIFARQLSEIIGKDKMIEFYSNNDMNNFLSHISVIDPTFDTRGFIISTYLINMLLNGVEFEDAESLGTDIQDQLITLANNSNSYNEVFSNLVITADKVSKVMPFLRDNVKEFKDCGFEGIDKLNVKSTDNVSNKGMDM